MASAGLQMHSGPPGNEGEAGVVEYLLPVIEDIQAQTLEGARSGLTGVEAGGVLFGTREGRNIRITTSRPLAGNYAVGPQFAVSEEDLTALGEIVTQAPSIRKLRGLEPVGWYRSNLEGDPALQERDVRIFERCFPEAWQLAVLIQPSESQPSRVRFYFRDREGKISKEASYREFSLGDTPQEEPVEEFAGPVAAATAEEPASAEAVHFSQPLAFLWPSVILLVLALAGILYWLAKPQRLALQAADDHGQLHITWNEAAGPIRNAQNAHLEITDGNAKVWLELTPDQIRKGSVTYGRKSNTVGMRLMVQPKRGVPIEEVTRFVGSGESLDAAPADDGRQRQLELEAEGLRRRLDEEAVQKARLEEMVNRLQAKPPGGQQPVPAATPRTASNPPPVAQPQRRFVPAPSQANRTVSTPDISPPPMVAENHLQANPDTLDAGAAAPAPPPQAKPPATPARNAISRPAAATASVGRLIWTGSLVKNGTVTIDGKTASSGALTGALPGKRIRIAVYPGNLAGDGISILTPHTQYAQPFTEPPGPQNGWNKTTYTYNQQRSGDVIVMESPGPQNSWNRIVLLSKTGRFSVIVVDWTILP